MTQQDGKEGHKGLWWTQMEPESEMRLETLKVPTLPFSVPVPRSSCTILCKGGEKKGENLPVKL